MTDNIKKNNMLMILDGYGYNPNRYGNAIKQANTPNLDKLFSENPHTQISASGLSVGLPDDQMGNSEVGHLNIGAGRIVYQDLTRISKEIEEGLFFKNNTFKAALDNVLKHHSSLHLMGLLSDGGVHSHQTHLHALLKLAKNKGINQVYIHAFLDGRDVPPRSASKYLNQLEQYIRDIGVGRIALISGRYYAMDRDRRWERVQKAYDAMTLGKGNRSVSATEALEAAYERNENDEFVTPTVICPEGYEPVTIDDHDSVIFFNFRPDRARQLTRSFTDKRFNGFKRNKSINELCYVCMTQYDAEMPNVLVAYPPQSLKNTLGEYISKKNMRQLRIAETEKYAHVTFFFNGGIEAPNRGEDRILVPSPKVATYDMKPEMSAYLVTDRVLEQISKKSYDFIILNFANADMVGHTGNMQAAVKAIETLDTCVARIVKQLQESGGQMILTSDHGNADHMMDQEGNTITAHSLSMVPMLVLTQEKLSLSEGGKLADIAPTLLDLAGLDKPAEMTGRSLLIRKP